MSYILSVTENYRDGKLARTLYFVNDLSEEHIPELIRTLRGEYPEIVRPDSEYINTNEPVSVIMMDPRANQVSLDRPLTQSELEEFAIELSKPLSED